MAIDTAEKRRTIGGLVMPLGPNVTPNAAEDSEWRAESGWSYLLAAAPGGVADINLWLRVGPYRIGAF